MLCSMCTSVGGKISIVQAGNIKIPNFRYRHCDVVKETTYQQHPDTSQCFGGTDGEINKENSLLTSHRSDSDKGFNCSV